MKELIGENKKCKNFHIPLVLYVQMYGNLMHDYFDNEADNKGHYPTAKDDSTTYKKQQYIKAICNIKDNLDEIFPNNKVIVKKNWNDLEIYCVFKENVNKNHCIVFSFIGNNLPSDLDCAEWIITLCKNVINPKFIEKPYQESLGDRIGLAFQTKEKNMYLIDSLGNRKNLF